MKTHITRDQCIDAMLAAIKSASHDSKTQKYLSYIVLAQFNCKKQMYNILQASCNKDAALDLMNLAIKEVLGPDYQFTCHGFEKSISDRYTNKEQSIVRRLQKFNKLLYDRLNIHAFIASGTLLGMVREGAFMGHDGDIDLAYVSHFSDKHAILKERDALITLINAQENMMGVVNNGVIKVRIQLDDTYFDFDLFTGYVEGDYVNIYLQRPNSIPKDAVLPLRAEEFYSEKINIPQKPEVLLEVNYGKTWRTPDRSFRYDLNEHLTYFTFLLPEDKQHIVLDQFDG